MALKVIVSTLNFIHIRPKKEGQLRLHKGQRDLVSKGGQSLQMKDSWKLCTPVLLHTKAIRSVQIACGIGDMWITVGNFEYVYKVGRIEGRLLPATSTPGNFFWEDIKGTTYLFIHHCENYSILNMLLCC